MRRVRHQQPPQRRGVHRLLEDLLISVLDQLCNLDAPLVRRGNDSKSVGELLQREGAETEDCVFFSKVKDLDVGDEGYDVVVDTIGILLGLECWGGWVC